MKNYITAILVCLISLLCLTCKTPARDTAMPSPPKIDTLKYGDFVEWIPQNGTVEADKPKGIKVIVPIDEIYLPKISKGLKATAVLDSQEFQLHIDYIYPYIHNGIFEVTMKFNGDGPQLPVGQKLRLRILTSEPSQQLLLPLGDFYSYTRGRWIYIVRDNVAIKHKIKLGRKSTEYFEVMDGLNAGDRVITSSYEAFKDRDSVAVAEIGGGQK